MKQKLRMGVVGLGMGRNHVKGFQSHSGAEVVAVCDANGELLHQQADEHDVKQRFTDPDEMFNRADLDAVSVATPNKFHAPISIAALKAGLHVLCEKPMAMNAKEAAQMNAAPTLPPLDREAIIHVRDHRRQIGISPLLG